MKVPGSLVINSACNSLVHLHIVYILVCPQLEFFLCSLYIEIECLYYCVLSV